MSKERWIMKNDLISFVDENIEIWKCDAKFICNQLNKQDQQIAEFQHQLKVSEKALELACKEITDSCEYCSYKTRIECPVEAKCLDEKLNYFKTKAKEMMKSE